MTSNWHRKREIKRTLQAWLLGICVAFGTLSLGIGLGLLGRYFDPPYITIEMSEGNVYLSGPGRFEAKLKLEK